MGERYVEEVPHDVIPAFPVSFLQQQEFKAVLDPTPAFAGVTRKEGELLIEAFLRRQE
jgi:hypothetical protein